MSVLKVTLLLQVKAPEMISTILLFVSKCFFWFCMKFLVYIIQKLSKVFIPKTPSFSELAQGSSIPFLCEWIIFHHETFFDNGTDIVRVWLPPSYTKRHKILQQFQYCYPNKNIFGWCYIDPR